MSKEYLTNDYILSKCFDLVFFQVHLVKISCKLITIRLSYKRNKKDAFCETPFTSALVRLSSFRCQWMQRRPWFFCD